MSGAVIVDPCDTEGAPRTEFGHLEIMTQPQAEEMPPAIKAVTGLHYTQKSLDIKGRIAAEESTGRRFRVFLTRSPGNIPQIVDTFDTYDSIPSFFLPWKDSASAAPGRYTGGVGAEGP
mmetsp:Transcript_30673/g.73974  ORF Transcript_30673/g.73974 Transcript_30673/m.73974 type:complete len:119 (+) Transcript_30673:496-852(+)